MAQTIDSVPKGHGLQVAVLVAQWHGAVTGRLLEGALAALTRLGVADDDVLVVEVPGAYELPQAAQWIARAQMADAIVALGCVIRGETPHFDHVARTTTDGCLRAAQESGIPVGLGVITADTQEQADQRSMAVDGGISQKGGNKGVEAADAAVRMAHTYRRLEEKLKG
jgi:6,7-dimethyl-8-ribityllumazine synthase